MSVAISAPGGVRERDLLVYDGDCAFCTRSVLAIDRRVHPDVEFTPWQQLDLGALGLTEQQVDKAVQWVGADGSRAAGAAAFSRVLRRAGRGWRAAGVLLALPPISWVAAGVYRVIAANRQRMPGGTAACALPARSRPTAK
jgi:predicted DCC family thiol-disulfide oxidoreductase YuxK